MGARILVIEDNPANLDLMIYLLGAFGHTALSATDGIEGLEAAKRSRPDLIICDVQLPTLDGYGVAHRLKQDPGLRGIPLIAVTAFAMPGDCEKALQAGFDGYIAKPIAPDLFLKQLDEFLPESKQAAVRTYSPVTASPPPVAQGRGTILVVDDSRINSELIRSTLEPMGYKLIIAHDLHNAVNLAGQQRLDMVLSDLHMPHGDGYEFIRVLKADPTHRDTPIVIISSTASGSIDPKTIASLGAAGLIVRPIEPGELLTQIEACLSQRAEV